MARLRVMMLVIAGAVALCVHAPSAEAQGAPDLLLTWNAPYGSNHATDYLTRDCGDTTRTDTLYLSYRMNQDYAAFTGILATLMFHPQFSDTLAEPWQTDQHDVPFLKVEFPTDTAATFKAGWKAAGVGAYRYYGYPTQGMVRMIFAVPATVAAPISAGTYSFARVIVTRPPQMERCDQGLCVEFRGAKFSFSINSPSVLGELKQQGFVTVNSPAGLACAKYKRMAESRKQEAQAKREAEREAHSRGAESAATDSTPR